MENKDRYQLFKDIYLELLHAELSAKLTSSRDNVYYTYESVSDVDMEKLHKLVFSRAFMLTAYVVNDVKESKIIS